PMQNVVVADILVRIEMEPALSAFVFRSVVPGNRQCLQPPVGELDQVLLKRVHAERVFHLIKCELAVRSVGLDQKIRVLAKKPRSDVEILKARAVKIAEHGLVRCMSHCAFMLGRVPKLAFGLMTARANLASRKSRFVS